MGPSFMARFITSNRLLLLCNPSLLLRLLLLLREHRVIIDSPQRHLPSKRVASPAGTIVKQGP